jgi:NADH:quinone reductase (non-electrogenic)
MAAPTRILILGGGFGGLHTARHLERLLPHDAGVEITLVSRDNFFLYTPMLHEIAACDVDITHIVSPIRTLLKRTNVFIGDVESIDVDARRVRVSHGFESHAHELAYDHLVVALGSITNFYGLPGLEAHALTMKTLGDAIHLRNRLIATLEEADTECAGGDDGLLTVVVAGGGFAGVETLAAVNDFVRDAARFYPRLDPTRIRMVLIHSGGVILPELGEHLGGYAQRILAERGLEIITNARVTAVTHDRVSLSDGRQIASRLLVWTAGTSPHPLIGQLPCPQERGRLAVDEMLRVKSHDNIWALGDCALVPDFRTGKPHPPTAQHAIREAKTVARNIAASLSGRPLQRFDFKTIGQLAAIGRRTGVARVFGINFSGFFAWWLWRTVYLSKLPRFEKKLRVAIDWTLDLLFVKDFVQFLTIRAEVMSLTEHAPGAPESRAPQVAVEVPQ